MVGYVRRPWLRTPRESTENPNPFSMMRRERKDTYNRANFFLRNNGNLCIMDFNIKLSN